MISREQESTIRKSIEQLPPKCKSIFRLIKEDGLSYKELAAIPGIVVKIVGTQLYIALKNLRGSFNLLGLKILLSQNSLQ
ncbi:MAG: sigma factor-like helix-turn-helix DNA-binding protein [Ginsengibacter sp.]